MKEQEKQKKNNILDIIRTKKLWKRYSILIVSLFISALIYNLLSVPTHIVSGGVGGVGIIIEHLFHISPSYTIFFLSFGLLLVSCLLLGIEKTSGTIVATVMYPLFVSITSDITNYITLEQTDTILVAIVIGIVGGICNGLTFKTGFSNGGLNIISQILYKYFKIAISKSNFVINAIVVIIGGFSFGFTMVMYAIIIIYINSLMINRVLLGVSKNKAFYIITDKDDEVRDYMMHELGHGITIFKVKSGYLGKRDDVIMAVVPTKEYYKVKEGIKLLDEKAFFIVKDAYQVEGGL